MLLFALLAKVNFVALQRGQNTLWQEKAKQNALLGLKEAISKIQNHAGSDFCISQTNLKKFDPKYGWLAVWKSGEPNKTWIVSQNKKKLETPKEIFHRNNHPVSVPVSPVDDYNQRRSSFSYWVSGENEKVAIKGMLSKTFAGSNFFEKYGTNTPSIPNVFGISTLMPNLDFTKPEIKSQLSRILSLGQLKYISNQKKNSQEFSQFTLESYGLLTSSNPKFPGFRHDLSKETNRIEMDYPEIGKGVQDYLQFYEKTILSGSKKSHLLLPLIAPSTLNLNQSYLINAPILTNFMLAFSLTSPSAKKPNLYTKARFFCELWNPYTHEIDAGFNNGGEFLLKIYGLPKVKMINALTGNRSEIVDFQKIFGDKGPMQIKLRHNTKEKSNRFLPGRTINYVGFNMEDLWTFEKWPTKSMDSKKWNDNSFAAGGGSGILTETKRIPASKIRIESSEATSLYIEMYHRYAESNESLVATYGPFNYYPFNTNPNGSSPKNTGVKFGYHIQLKGPHHSNVDPEKYRGRWLVDHDPRDPTMLKDRPDWNLYSRYTSVNDAATPIFPNPSEVHHQSIGSVKHDRLFDRSKNKDGEGYTKLYQDAPVFELPRRPLLSLGELQHLYIHGKAPFSVGNSWGSKGETNTSDWFDRYYFSGNSLTDMGNHPAYYKIGLEDGVHHSKNHLIKGAFNINSCDPLAWKAFLSSIHRDPFKYNLMDENKGTPLGTFQIKNTSNYFNRYAHSAHETYFSPNSPIHNYSEKDLPERIAPTKCHRQGFTILNEDQISKLSEKIANKIALRDRPFQHISEFLSPQPNNPKSLLEECLDKIQEALDIDTYSATYLTQADLLSSLAPFITTRNDTFKILSKGEVKNNLTGQLESSIHCEAILQKIPELQSDLKTIFPVRKFKIISFRWF